MNDSSCEDESTNQNPGINLAFVQLALLARTKVLVADLKLTPEAESVVNASRGNAAFATCDVTQWADLERLPSEVIKAFGSGAIADIWIAGAGVFEPKWSSFLYDTEDDHYKAMQINAEHPIKLTRIAMRSSLGANKPCVVLITASSAGLVGTYGAALYCASKHAVVGFTKSMRQADVDENVKVVCVCPGIVATPLWTAEAAKNVAAQFSYTDDIALTADEVAQAMRELIEDGKYAGGAVLRMSKGNLREVVDVEQVTAVDMARKAWIEGTYKPVREHFGKERGAKKP